MGRPALHSKIMSTERNFLPNGARREEITPSLNHHRGSPQQWIAVESAYFFTIGQLPSARRNACAAGIVSTSL